METWKSTSLTSLLEPAFQHIQKAWDGPVVNSIIDRMVSAADTDIDLARPKAASAPHSEDWLHAAPIASVGLKLYDEEIRISVAQRLGITTCSPHNCICGKLVDARGLHDLSCRKSTPRHQRHAMLNDLIWRAIKIAHIPAHKKPTGLVTQGGKRPKEPLSSRGLTIKRSPGTSLFSTPTPIRILAEHHWKPEQQPNKQRL